MVGKDYVIGKQKWNEVKNVQKPFKKIIYTDFGSELAFLNKSNKKQHSPF